MVSDVLLPFVQQPDRAAVLVDFDGTLSPIVDRPEHAVPLPAARDALGALVGECALVGVVSGRPVQFLHDALALDGVEYVGQYGLERLAGGAVVAEPGVERYRAAIARAADAADAAFPDLYVERKGSIAVTLHWRTASARAEVAEAWVAETAAREGLEVFPTRMAAELRPPVVMDKGMAVARLLGRAGESVALALFAGDDHGDLSAFRALSERRDSGGLEHAVCVGVRSAEAPPELLAAADVVVDGPAGVAGLLHELSVAIRRERA